MSPKAQQITEMIDMLPEEDQIFAVMFIRKLVLAWDPDFTKQTPVEAERLREAIRSMDSGEYYTMNDVESLL